MILQMRKLFKTLAVVFLKVLVFCLLLYVLLYILPVMREFRRARPQEPSRPVNKTQFEETQTSQTDKLVWNALGNTCSFYVPAEDSLLCQLLSSDNSDRVPQYLSENNVGFNYWLWNTITLTPSAFVQIKKLFTYSDAETENELTKTEELLSEHDSKAAGAPIFLDEHDWCLPSHLDAMWVNSSVNHFYMDGVDSRGCSPLYTALYVFNKSWLLKNRDIFGEGNSFCRWANDFDRVLLANTFFLIRSIKKDEPVPVVVDLEKSVVDFEIRRTHGLLPQDSLMFRRLAELEAERDRLARYIDLISSQVNDPKKKKIKIINDEKVSRAGRRYYWFETEESPNSVNESK